MVVNLFGDDWDAQRDRPGFSWKRLGVGERLGSELLGASLYELPPGQRTWPYHFQYGNEEWLIIFDGTPTLRTPEGERELEPGDVAVFRRGPEGAHQVVNRSGRPARVLIVSTMIEHDIAEYPDSGKIGVFAGERPVLLRKDASVDYWEGEPGDD